MKHLKFMSLCWGVLLVGIITVMTLFATDYLEVKDYKDYEIKLKDLTKTYVKDVDVTLPNKGEIKKIGLNVLVENVLVENLKVKTDKCEGYVIITKNLSYKYKTYLKCKNYTTKGYKE